MGHFGIIYLAVNRINHKAYVGQTKIQFRHRIFNHVSVALTKGSRTPFHRALRKCGPESFDFGVLEHTLQLALDDREAYWISQLGSKTPCGYNRTDGGQGATGCKYTPERREAIRRSQLGDNNRMKNPETVRKHADAIRGERHVNFGKYGPDHPSFGLRYENSEQGRLNKRIAFNRPEVVARRKELASARKRGPNGAFLKETI